MLKEEYFKTIKKTLISEKAHNILAKSNCVTFLVNKNATKELIKKSVENIFKVNVIAVQTLNTKGKVKRHGAKIGKRNDTKKAYVTLAEGHTIADDSKAKEDLKSKNIALDKNKVGN